MTLIFRELPPMLPEMRMWYATEQGHSFVIVLEERMDENLDDWSGYSVSWRKLPDGKTNKIGKPFHKSFDAARDACEHLAEQLKWQRQAQTKWASEDGTTQGRDE